MYERSVYLLDLCTLAYQLHSQTLIWPMDPYSEQMQIRAGHHGGGSRRRRKDFLQAAKDYYRQNHSQGSYRGPAFLAGAGDKGWTDNPALDPVISKYARVHPWRPGIVRPERGGWIVYRTPREITDRIGKVHVVSYDPGSGPNADAAAVVKVGQPALRPKTITSPGPDVLYCVEGGTGAVPSVGAGAGAAPPRPGASWSLMGFVLARAVGGQKSLYDIDIVFRGSRSGTARMQPGVQKRGNPDWATDLAWKQKNDPEINPYPGHRGFQQCVRYTLPTVMASLSHIADNLGLANSIRLTGHSLGGAMACHLASALTLGQSYVPQGRGWTTLSTKLKAWPWDKLELVTFSAPPVGSAPFVSKLNRAVPATTRVRHRMDLIANLGSPALHPGRDDPVGGRGRGRLDAHDPFYLRRALIKELKDDATALANVPAQNDGESPWRNCKTLREAIQCYNASGVPITHGLRDLDEGLQQYFEIFGSILGKEGIPQPLAPTTVADDQSNLSAWCGKLRTIPADNDADFRDPAFDLAAVAHDDAFKNFMRLCIVLSAISRSQDAIKVLDGLPTAVKNPFG